MENNFKITFWLNRTKKNAKNLVPVYLRVCQNYDHFVKSTGVLVNVSDWDKKAMRVKGLTPEVNVTNNQLDALKVKIMQIINHLNLVGSRLTSTP